MTEIFVIAEEELVIAFRLAGVHGRAVGGREEALAAFRMATSGAGGKAEAAKAMAAKTADDQGLPSGVKILVLGEDVADMLGQELDEWQLSGEYPLVVEIPPLSGSRPGRATISDAVRRAVGIQI